MKKEIQRLIHLSWNEAQQLWIYGHISDRVWAVFQRVWEWRGPLLSSWRQDVFYNRYGKERYYAKINKTRQAFGVPPIST
jgi:hypothetical protein